MVRVPGKAARDVRGYGTAHERERRKWARVVACGNGVCCRCGEPIPAGTASAGWHLDHTDDRLGYRGIAHASCNLKAGASLGGRRRARQRKARAAVAAPGPRADAQALDRPGFRRVSRPWSKDVVSIDGRLYMPIEGGVS
jgi:hypothetical protein